MAQWLVELAVVWMIARMVIWMIEVVERTRRWLLVRWRTSEIIAFSKVAVLSEIVISKIVISKVGLSEIVAVISKVVVRVHEIVVAHEAVAERLICDRMQNGRWPTERLMITIERRLKWRMRCVEFIWMKANSHRRIEHRRLIIEERWLVHHRMRRYIHHHWRLVHPVIAAGHSRSTISIIIVLIEWTIFTVARVSILLASWLL